MRAFFSSFFCLSCFFSLSLRRRVIGRPPAAAFAAAAAGAACGGGGRRRTLNTRKDPFLCWNARIPDARLIFEGVLPLLPLPFLPSAFAGAITW